MPKSPARPRHGIELAPVPARDKAVLRNLMSLYLHDLSEYTDSLTPGPDGLFTYDGLDLYWRNPSLTPLFIRQDSELVGFLLLNRPPYTTPDTDFNIHEFFILRRHRGRGIGRNAAAACLEQFPGRYIVVQLIRNVPAIGFWHSVYAGLDITYEEREQTFGSETCLVQTFRV